MKISLANVCKSASDTDLFIRTGSRYRQIRVGVVFGKQVLHILNIGTSTRPTDKKQNYENSFTVFVTVLWIRIRIQSGPEEFGSGVTKAKWTL